MNTAKPVIKINRRKETVAFFLVFSMVVLFSLYFLKRLVVPFGVAFVFYLILKPILQQCRSKSVYHTIFISLIFLVAFLIVLYAFTSSLPYISGEFAKLQDYVPRIEEYLRSRYSYVTGFIERKFNYELDFNPVDTAILYLQQTLKLVIIKLPYFLSTAMEWFFMVPIFLLFIIKDGFMFKKQLLKVVPNSWAENFYHLINQFTNKFGDYIFAKFIEASLVGIVITSGLVAIDYPLAFILGLIAALTNVFPYIGPFLGYVPALIVGLVDQNPNTTLGALSVLYLVANLIDIFIVFPLLVSKIVNLHPLVVILSVIIGSGVAGFLGMVVSIPVAAIVKLTFTEVYEAIYHESETGL